jgi:S-adenosylmethionine hydrolase
VSTTFHGRDIFAPVAATLSRGVKPAEFGSLIDDEVRLPQPLAPLQQKNGKVRGRIIQIDRFGNCVTNITRDFFDSKKHTALFVNGKTIREVKEFYGENGAAKGLFVIWGSAGFLEISVNGGSAAKVLRAKRGDAVVLT